MRRAVSALALALFALAESGPVGAEQRVALVIGNSAYRDAPLRNPVNDARLIAAALEEVGFQVELDLDASQKAMKRAIVGLGARMEQAGPSGVGLFYFAGHGVQVNGQNFLVPVDAAIGHERDVSVEAVPASAVTDVLGFSESQVMIVVLDACRNNPFARGSRSAARGLAKMEAPAGTLIAYATAPGDVAADGDGANSPFSLALARSLREPGLPIELVFKETRKAVHRLTGRQQTPWEHSSLTGDFYFVAPRPTADVAAAPASGPEVEFWRSIERSENPAEFDAYVERYPKGAFVELARLRSRELQSDGGASQNRERIAFSEALDVDVFAEFDGLGWCAPALRLRFEAADPGVFSQPGFVQLVQKLSRVISRDCPEAASAKLIGFRRGSHAPAFTRSIRASEHWRLAESP